MRAGSEPACRKGEDQAGLLSFQKRRDLLEVGEQGGLWICRGKSCEPVGGFVAPAVSRGLCLKKPRAARAAGSPPLPRRWPLGHGAGTATCPDKSDAWAELAGIRDPPHTPRPAAHREPASPFELQRHSSAPAPLGLESGAQGWGSSGMRESGAGLLPAASVHPPPFPSASSSAILCPL